MQHRKSENGLQISFWKGNAAAVEEEADRVRVTAANSHWPEMEFELPGQKREYDALLRFVWCGALHGMRQKEAEIRKVLGLS